MSRAKKQAEPVVTEDEVKDVAPATPEPEAKPAEAKAPEPDVAPGPAENAQGDAENAVDDTEEDATNAQGEGVPDHLVHRTELEDYARLRGLNVFEQAILTRAVGEYARPFEDWETARQAVIGG